MTTLPDGRAVDVTDTGWRTFRDALEIPAQ
jgi:hypothetical protein